MARLFTSESVTEGHPDKVCDCISDAVLDEIFSKDPNARVACECMVTTDKLFMSGEISTSCEYDAEEIARRTIREIGYTSDDIGFNADTCVISNNLHTQSADIALGVDNASEIKEGSEDRYDQIGAGDQGMMFGYACNETEELMPLPISLAHKLALKLTEVRKNGTLPYLRPDGKTQVTVEYDDDDAPVCVDTVVISTQHDADVSLDKIRADLAKHVILPVIPKELITVGMKIHINPTGRFVIGGPNGDTGLTGRKIIVDTYGGYARHGGGAFSGKDPTKVDRSAAYMARYIAKNIVAAGLAWKCEIQLSYAIGMAKPVSVLIDTFETGAVADEELAEAVNQVFDLRPAAIIDTLGLRAPIYRQTAAYGHFGRNDVTLPWEQTDKVQELCDAVGVDLDNSTLLKLAQDN